MVLSLGLKLPGREADHYIQTSDEYKAKREAMPPLAT